MMCQKMILYKEILFSSVQTDYEAMRYLLYICKFSVKIV